MSTPRSYELSFSSYPGRSPPSSLTFIASVAISPSMATFQCRYRDGSVRKSIGCSVFSVMPSSRRLAQNHPQRPGGPGPDVFPSVPRAAVEQGAVARLERMTLAVVVQRHLAVEHVEELHLPRLDHEIVGGCAARSRGQRRDHRADLAVEQPGAEDAPALGGAVERHDRIVLLPRHVNASRRLGIEQARDRHAERPRDLAAGVE